MRLLVALVVGSMIVACRRAAPLDVAGPAPEGDARAVVVDANASSDGAPIVDAAPSAFVAKCIRELEIGIAAAATIDADFAAPLHVESEVLDDGNGAHRERVSIAGRLGFGCSVDHVTPPTTDAASGWGTRAESLHGSYHAMHVRSDPHGEAFVSFDGFPPALATTLAPLFEDAIDRCL